MKFNTLYEELKFGDVFKAATPEEVAERRDKYADIKIKEVLDGVKKTKLPDGSWHVHEEINIVYSNISSLKNLNVSIVDGTFSCSDNVITSLIGSPKEVRGNFFCSDNQLTTLEGAPEAVGGTFYCGYNQLATLKGAPKKVGKDFGCWHNRKKFTKDDVKAICNVKGAIVV